MIGEGIDYLVVGHITWDVGDGPSRLGGTAYYAALTAHRLGRRVGIVTSITNEMAVELASRLPGVALHASTTTRPTTFENRYRGDQREQRLLSRAGALGWDNIPPPWRQARLIHLGPVAQEVDPALLDRFTGQFIGVTPQGWLRTWDAAGLVRPAPLPFARTRLHRVTALVFSSEDVRDEKEANRLAAVARYGVQTRASKGAILYDEAGTHTVPARRTTVVDPTGAGDVFAAALFIRLAEGAEPEHAVHFAHAAASLAIAQSDHSSLPARRMIEAVLTET